MSTARSAASTLITIAPTGAETAKADFPALPTTPEELVETAVSCERAGAALIHIHVRDRDHQPTLDQVFVRRPTSSCSSRPVGPSLIRSSSA